MTNGNGNGSGNGQGSNVDPVIQQIDDLFNAPHDGAPSYVTPPYVARPNEATPPNVAHVPTVTVGERPEKFNGLHFKRWQQKMLFYLTTLGLAICLKEDPPVDDDVDDQSKMLRLFAWQQNDYKCRNYIMNGLSDSLYDVYINVDTAKQLWESLEKKYKTEDAGAKKFIVGRFLEWKMTDSKKVMSQLSEFQLILHEIQAEGMVIGESFQVASCIEKLPPSWKEFKNYLKHKRKEMTMEDLEVRLRIEEDNRGSEKRSWMHQHSAKANVMEHGQSSTKGAKPRAKLGPKGGINKKTKFDGKCFNCDKKGHKSSECTKPKRNRKQQAHILEDVTKDVSELNLCCMISEVTAINKCSMISEVNMADANPKGWWLDTGATKHICADEKMFSNLEKSDGELLFMGNSATSPIKGKGKVILKMTSGKELTLSNVLYVPEIRKNLISGAMLNAHGFRIVIESDKIILSKHGMFVGKGYVMGGMLKMSVMTIVKKNMNEASSSTYMLESSNLWHGRLGHVNYNTLRKLINMEHLPTFQIDPKHKCEICVESKLTRSSFQNVERNTEPLDLIHTDVCNLKQIVSRGGNKYFITFIDDSTKYCYVYLLKSKKEAIDKFVLYKNEVENQLDKKIKVLRSDRGGEYEFPFNEICAQNGIIHQRTAPYSPQSNGVAERKNRTLKDMMNAMLLSSGLPPNMWGDAILTANYLLNKIPKKKAEKTPYELWKGSKPSYSYLRVWGCMAKVVIPRPKAVKNGPKTVDCIFIGYAQNSNAYRFLVHKSKIEEIHENTIMESRNASFFENIFPCKLREQASSSKRSREESEVDLEGEPDEDQPNEVEPIEVEPIEVEPTEVRKPKGRRGE